MMRRELSCCCCCHKECFPLQSVTHVRDEEACSRDILVTCCLDQRPTLRFCST